MGFIVFLVRCALLAFFLAVLIFFMSFALATAETCSLATPIRCLYFPKTVALSGFYLCISHIITSFYFLTMRDLPTEGIVKYTLMPWSFGVAGAFLVACYIVFGGI
jgi:hypothetical protein